MSVVGRSTAVIVTALALVGVVALPAAAKSDKQIAKAAALKVSDLGQEWDATKHVDEGPSGIAACAGTDEATKDGKKYEFNSPDFAQGDAEVTNTVYVFPNVKAAKAYLGAYQDPTALDCLQETLDDALAEEPAASANVEELDVSGGPASDGVGFEATLTVPDGATEVTFIFEAIAFRVGRAVTGISTKNADEALPITADLATTSIKRLENGLK